jgi:hypothetical protein
MTEIPTKVKKHINASLQQRDANGRFAPAKRPVGRPRKQAVKNSLSKTVHAPIFNPTGFFGYDDDADELPSAPYTSERVERIKTYKHRIAVLQWINTFLLVMAFLLVVFIYALLLTALYDWRQP